MLVNKSSINLSSEQNAFFIVGVFCSNKVKSTEGKCKKPDKRLLSSCHWFGNVVSELNFTEKNK